MSVWWALALGCAVFAAISFFVAVTTEHSHSELSDGAFLLGLLAGVVTIGFFITAAQTDENRDNARDKRIDQKVENVCKPYQVTNKTANDDRIVFDCADHGIIHIIKK